MADREKLLGRRAVLKEREYNLRVAIDTLVKNVNDLFAPMDSGMRYVEDIDIRRLRVQVLDIERNHKLLMPLLQEIKNLNDELGEE